MEITDIPRGACATLTGIDLCIMRVEEVEGQLWAQLLATHGPHQEVCMLPVNDPLDLADGGRLTILAIMLSANEEPVVRVGYEPVQKMS